jgi:hypothetical protein
MLLHFLWSASPLPILPGDPWMFLWLVGAGDWHGTWNMRIRGCILWRSERKTKAPWISADWFWASQSAVQVCVRVCVKWKWQCLLSPPSTYHMILLKLLIFGHGHRRHSLFFLSTPSSLLLPLSSSSLLTLVSWWAVSFFNIKIDII